MVGARSEQDRAIKVFLTNVTLFNKSVLTLFYNSAVILGLKFNINFREILKEIFVVYNKNRENGQN